MAPSLTIFGDQRQHLSRWSDRQSAARCSAWGGDGTDYVSPTVITRVSNGYIAAVLCLSHVATTDFLRRRSAQVTALAKAIASRSARDRMQALSLAPAVELARRTRSVTRRMGHGILGAAAVPWDQGRLHWQINVGASGDTVLSRTHAASAYC